MPKKRLIFTLLYSDGMFCLSRNFRLQKVGNLEWLSENYNFEGLAKSIDELVILDVSRGNRNKEKFLVAVSKVTSRCFMPLALGGGIRTIEDADLLIKNGADKIVLNTLLSSNSSVVKELASKYGSQSLIASVDYTDENGDYIIYTDCGKNRLNMSLESYLEYLIKLGVGELYLNSMDRDGTGQGYDTKIINGDYVNLRIPVIVSGGAGNKEHLRLGLKSSYVDAVATAHLFNFMRDGLKQSRDYLIETGIDLAKWV